LLGSAQSGFIASVGFDAYCELLAEAIAQRRGGPSALQDRREAVIDVKIDAFIPNDYISQVSQKIAVYQQLARARTEEEVEEVAAGVRDRFGAFPRPLANLVELTKLRAVALRKRVTRVVVDERPFDSAQGKLTLGVGSGFELDPAAVPKLQTLTKNRFRFADGRILVDLPASSAWMPLLRKLLEAL
jgi:transcription-repair coupling factor (superfamily II helicase)